MIKFMSKAKNIILPALIFVSAFITYQFNALGSVEYDFFKGFQKDSEALVFGGIVSSEQEVNNSKWFLGFLVDNNTNGMFWSNDSTEFTPWLERKPESLSFAPYGSSVGIQGYVYAVLRDTFKMDHVFDLQNFPSALMALLVAGLYCLHLRLYGVLYAVLFALTLVFSPWVAAISRNLYWSPFLWLLPLFFATSAYLSKSRGVKFLCYLLILLSFFIKSLCGYEYITSITILACSPFILGPLFNGGSICDFKSAGVVFLMCVLGFSLAFLIHADKRGDGIISGIETIYKQDVKRRTYSDPSSFAPVYKDSLISTPMNVLHSYTLQWRTPLFYGIDGAAFKNLILLALIGLLAKLVIARETFVRDVFLVLFMALVPISWFVMAKGHSYTHTHINFVLWYFGFIPALLFVCTDTFISLINKLIKMRT